MSALLFETGSIRRPFTVVLASIACLATAVAAAGVLARPAAGWSGILTAASYGIGLALGGALFFAINVATGATWWLPLRRVPLLVARTLAVPAFALGLALVFGLQSLYPWARPGAMAASPLLRQKEAWLNEPLFLARAVVVLLVWFSFIGALRQRLEASPAPRDRGLVRTAVAFLVLFAVTISVASWDWTMSLEPEWSSTMYAVYVFAGTLLGGIAAVAVLALLLDRAGLLPQPLAPAQLHDLGKLLFAFATFWAYIWFCQFLLVWYTDLPEEVVHYATRLTGGWSLYFWLNPVLNFAVPFVTLLSIRTKRHAATLLQAALVVLLGRWLDTYLLIGPAAGPAPAFPLAAAAASLAVVATMALAVLRSLAREGRVGSSNVRRAA